MKVVAYDNFGAGGQCLKCVGDQFLNSCPKSRGAEDPLEKRTGKQNHLKERNSCSKYLIFRMQRIVKQLLRKVRSLTSFFQMDALVSCYFCNIFQTTCSTPPHPLILLTPQDFGGFPHPSVQKEMGYKLPITFPFLLLAKFVSRATNILCLW